MLLLLLLLLLLLFLEFVLLSVEEVALLLRLCDGNESIIKKTLTAKIRISSSRSLNVELDSTPPLPPPQKNIIYTARHMNPLFFLFKKLFSLDLKVLIKETC